MWRRGVQEKKNETRKRFKKKQTQQTRGTHKEEGRQYINAFKQPVNAQSGNSSGMTCFCSELTCKLVFFCSLFRCCSSIVISNQKRTISEQNVSSPNRNPPPPPRKHRGDYALPKQPRRKNAWKEIPATLQYVWGSFQSD